MVVGDLNRNILFEDLKIIEDCGMHASISHEDDYAVAMVTLETTIEIIYW